MTPRPSATALNDPDPRVRFAALEALREAALDDPRDVAASQAFAAAVDDPDRDVRESSLYSLRFFATDTARLALLAAAGDRDLDPELRALAVEGLAGTGGGATVRRALLRLLGDPLPPLRFWAAHSLGAVGDDTAVPALESLLAQPDEAVPPYGTLHAEAREAIAAIRDRG